MAEIKKYRKRPSILPFRKERAIKWLYRFVLALPYAHRRPMKYLPFVLLRQLP